MILHPHSSQSGILMFPVLVVLILILGIAVGIASLLTGELKSQRGLPASQEALSAAEVGIERMERIDSCVAIADEALRFDCLEEYAGATAALFKDWKCDKKKLDSGKCLEGAIEHISGGSLDNGATYELEVVKQGVDCKVPMCFFSTGTFENIVRKIELKRTTASLFPCGDDLDVMLVLDRSGSIDNTEEGQLKTAANAFVDVLAPSAGTVHIGQVSFGDPPGGPEGPPSLDQELTSSSIALHAAIDALVTEAATHMAPAFTIAKDELGSVRDRDDTTSPDFIVFITDGAPDDDGNNIVPAPTVIAAAQAAKDAGIEIFVVGIEPGGSAAFKLAVENFLKNDIASTPTSYFKINNYADLEAKLGDLCGAGPVIFF